MKKIISILMAFLPALASAQVGDILIYEPSIWEKTEGIIRDVIAWPALCLLIIVIGSWLILIPLKKRVKRFKLIHASLAISVFCVWYFYPCMNYKGSYTTESIWDKDGLMTISIGDNYSFEGEVLGEHRVNPFARLLWVKTDRAPTLVFGDLPVKLRWNRIYQPVFKHGWVEFKKDNSANQSLEAIVTTPVD